MSWVTCVHQQQVTSDKQPMTNFKPIIGLSGGIGAGKSFVAQLFAEFGCLVLSADEEVSQLYTQQSVRQQLRDWWGNDAFTPTGEINRPWIAQHIFTNASERKKLENLLHPRVQALRTEKMNQFANDSLIVAFIWDVPLLFETGHD